MSGNPQTPAAPVAHDVVEIVDRLSGARTPAIVESANGEHYVLVFERATSASGETPVRWYDRDTAWQAVSQIQRIDETSELPYSLHPPIGSPLRCARRCERRSITRPCS